MENRILEGRMQKREVLTIMGILVNIMVVAIVLVIINSFKVIISNTNSKQNLRTLPARGLSS